MSLDIRGAAGYLWEITRRGYGKVLAISQSTQEQNALRDSRTWSATGTVTPTGAGDNFFYLRNNTTNTNRLVVTRVGVRSTGADVVRLFNVTGTPSGGTTKTPSNRTISSGKVPDATIESGVDITGVTTVFLYELLNIGALGKDNQEIGARPLILNPGDAFVLQADTGTTAMTFLVDFYTDLSDPQVVA